MPTYTYVCAACGHRYDAFQNMSSTPDTICPECQGQVERLIGAGSGVVFKGSGFYVTDYRKGGSGESGGDSGGKSEGGDTKKSGGAETKKGESAASGGSSDSAKTSDSSKPSSSSKSSNSSGSGGTSGGSAAS